MAGEPTDSVLEHLRRIDRKVEGVREDVQQLNLRIGSIERILSGQYVADVDQNAEIDRLRRGGPDRAAARAERELSRSVLGA